MSLKRRNGIACGLLLLAAVLWTFGYGMVQEVPGNGIAETSFATAYTATEWTTPDTESSTPSETTPGVQEAAQGKPDGKFLGVLLCFLSAAAGITGVIGLRQTAPVLGPDGVSMLLAIGGALYYFLGNMDYILWSSTLRVLTVYANIIVSFAVLVSARELWGWARAKFRLSWCLSHRAAKRLPRPQLCLLVYVGWIILTLTGLGCHLIWFARYGSLRAASLWGFLAAAVFGFLCLWRYGADLEHFKMQLDNFQQGRPIAVGDGAFARTEAQLLEVQAQHEEAVRTAVTSERFKVELISNVSHDLRTPLTAILGYSELLQKENLSPEGQEQLHRLHQKAGYMLSLIHI